MSTKKYTPDALRCDASHDLAETRSLMERCRKRLSPRPATPDELREAEAMGQMRLPGVFHDEGK